MMTKSDIHDLFMLSGLTDNERIVLQHRFGFGGPQKTLKATGELIGVGPERVRQIQWKALRKVKLRFYYEENK